MLASFSEFSAAFPDIQLTMMAMVAENDLVVAYWKMTGTQVAEFRDTPPVDVEVTYAGFNLFRIECGLVAESWNESDHLGRLMQQGTITQDELESVGTPTP
jgi:predicted ester cyclase